MKKILLVIPDMNGRYSVVKKNLRVIVGKPLIGYAIETAKKIKGDCDVVVATDNKEMMKMCDYYNTKTVNVPFNKIGVEDITLDAVIKEALKKMEVQKGCKYDTVITVQPTSPLLKPDTLDDALDFFYTSSYDTIISGINKPNLSWEKVGDVFVPQYKERKNRKFLPKHLIETGTFVINSRQNIEKGSRIGKNVYIYEISKHEGLELINEYDLLIVEKELSKKTILIRIDGYKEIGMGHIYRGLQLADLLIEHNVMFVVSKKSKLAIEKIKESEYPCFVIDDNEDIFEIIEKNRADIVVNDILNTSSKYMKQLQAKKVRIVNFEDLGDGAFYADAVINDLYEPQNEHKNFYWGSRYYCLRDDFLNLKKKQTASKQIDEILVMFGGTDPSNLTQKIFRAFEKFSSNHKFHVTFIMGAGNEDAGSIKALVENKTNNIRYTIVKDSKTIGLYMSKADIAISSQGRTMYELAYMQVPTIILAQNERELLHEFGYLTNGFINLGLGSKLSVDTIYETVLWLMNCHQVRQQIKGQMKKMDLEKGIYRVRKLILGE